MEVEENEVKRGRGGSKPVGDPKEGGRKPVKWHKESKRIQAAAAYAATGSNKLASEISGVPAATIAQWKTQEWWPDLLERVRREADDELDTKFTKNINKAVSEINERLEEGDWQYNAITGEIVRKPINAKDLGILTSIMVEKRELIRGRKKTYSDSASVAQRLEKIATDIRKLVGGAKIIEGEVIEKEITYEQEQDPEQVSETTPEEEVLIDKE